MTAESNHSQPFTELVPLVYDRKFYNLQARTSLEAHADHLTAEQAQAINDHFDLRLYLGAHGQRGGYDPIDEEYKFLRTAPTQAEYETASQAVESMRPGDVLFIEGYGFTHQHARRNTEADAMMQNLTGMILGIDMEKFRIAQMQSLETQRRAYKISAWDYAEQLAELKGIQVVKADYDAFDMQTAQLSTEDIDWLNSSGDPTDQARVRHWHEQRERKAVNIVKDWAIEHLDNPLPADGRKPKLVVLFGGNHGAALQARIAMNLLDAEVYTMEVSDIQNRVTEHVNHVIGQSMSEIVRWLTQETFPDTLKQKKDVSDYKMKTKKLHTRRSIYSQHLKPPKPTNDE